MLSTKIRRSFGLLSDTFGFLNPSSFGYIIGTYPPHRALPEHTPVIQQDSEFKLNSTTLPNGVRIVTQSGGFPSSVYMGVTLNCGTRDQSFKNSSVIFALNQTFMKTSIRTNEQLNYCMIQMSGGEFTSIYNQEFMNYHGHCLAHDTYDFVQMMSDMILDEKTLADEQAQQWRIDEWWRLKEFNSTIPKRIEELWLSTAYGYTGLGMPLSGFQSNFQNIGYYAMNNFRKQYITPDRMVVWGAGVTHHQEFVDTVTPYFIHLDPVKGPARAPTNYIGGEHREIQHSDLTHVGLSFHGLSRMTKEIDAAYVLKYIIGSSNGTYMNRTADKFRQKYPWMAYIDPHHATFEDSGNFRINFAAPNEKIGELVDALTNEIGDLIQNITEDDVAIAKYALKNATFQKFDDPATRMIKYSRDFSQGKPLIAQSQLLDDIDKVTVEQVKDIASRITKTNPTLVVIGGNPHGVPNAEQIHSRLKQNKDS